MKDLIDEKGHEVIPRHYAFLAVNEAERLQRRDQLSKSNIYPIWYPSTDDHNECIEALLHKLMES